MSLCKLSIKEFPSQADDKSGKGGASAALTAVTQGMTSAAANSLDQRYIKSKRLTLDLIFSMLANAGPVFR